MRFKCTVCKQETAELVSMFEAMFAVCACGAIVRIDHESVLEKGGTCVQRHVCDVPGCSTIIDSETHERTVEVMINGNVVFRIKQDICDRCIARLVKAATDAVTKPRRKYVRKKKSK